jgi:asparagine synthetase B (glutamine-hydrolysing)
MSGICGWVGDAGDKDTLERMLRAIDYRGDTSVLEDLRGATLG